MGNFLHDCRIFSNYLFLNLQLLVSCVDTLSPLTAALHVVDLILRFLSCTVGTWSFGLFQQTICVWQHLSYIKKQQEQAEAQTKQYHQSNQQWKPVPIFW